MQEKAIKNDGNWHEKPRMDLIPALAIMETAKVFGYGAKKYSDHNWKNGLRIGRLLAAGLRHIFKHLAGQDNDEETGLSHLAHASCCILMALDTYIANPDMDDRFKNS